jgi:hypothetical protein
MPRASGSRATPRATRELRSLGIMRTLRVRRPRGPPVRSVTRELRSLEPRASCSGRAAPRCALPVPGVRPLAALGAVPGLQSSAYVGRLPRARRPFHSRPVVCGGSRRACPSPGRAASPARGSARAPGRGAAGRPAGSEFRKRAGASPGEPASRRELRSRSPRRSRGQCGTPSRLQSARSADDDSERGEATPAFGRAKLSRSPSERFAF